MDIAIVTGANTRIGLAISRKLIETGCRVYGLGSNFNDLPLEHADFIPVTCDLTRTEHLCQIVQEIIDKEKNIYVLVNHARHVNLAPHEKQSLNDLESLVHMNLLAPLLLTRLALPALIRLRGYIINIGFPDLPGSRYLGSAFLSTEVAMQEFSDRIYEEVRQDKVKVCSLILDTANAESLFREGFTERDNHDLIVCSEATAQAVEYIISQKKESVVSRLVVRPQKREPDPGDQAGVRTVSAPQRYEPRTPTQKIVIGRLKKEVEKPSDKKAPATYMKMAREVTEEESRTGNLPDQSVAVHSSAPESTSPNRNRRRRRGRNRNRNREPQASNRNTGSTNQPPKPPQKGTPDGRAEPQSDKRSAPIPSVKTSSVDMPAADKGSSGRRVVGKKRPQHPPKKSFAKKMDTEKSVPRKAPAKKAAGSENAVKKVPAKKRPKKPVAKRAVKKIAKKRPTPESKEA